MCRNDLDGADREVLGWCPLKKVKDLTSTDSRRSGTVVDKEDGVDEKGEEYCQRK